MTTVNRNIPFKAIENINSLVIFLLIVFFTATAEQTAFAQAPLKQFTSKGKCGYKNANGQVVVPAEYDCCFDYNSGPNFKYLGPNRVIVVSGGIKNKELVIGWQGGKWGMYNAEGKLVIPVEFAYISNFYSTYGPGLLKVGKDEKMGIYDSTGRVILPPNADKLYFSDYAKGINFRENHFHANGLIPFLQDDKYGVVDFSGNMILEPIYDCITNFSHYADKKSRVEYCLVQKADKIGLLYTNGKIIPCIFDSIFVVKSDHTKISDVLRKDNLITCFTGTTMDYQENFLLGKYGDSFQIIGKGGQLIPVHNFQNLTLVASKFLIGKINGKYGVVKNDGVPFIPSIYDSVVAATSVSQEYIFFKIKADDKWGVFSGEDGSEIAPLVYDEIADFKTALCVAFAGRKNEEWIFFDKKHELKTSWMKGTYINKPHEGILLQDGEWIYTYNRNCKIDPEPASGQQSKELSPLQKELSEMANKYAPEQCPTCTYCKGSGKKKSSDFKYIRCRQCNGDGKYRYKIGIYYTDYVQCSTCLGSGQERYWEKQYDKCVYCNGKGCIER